MNISRACLILLLPMAVTNIGHAQPINSPPAASTIDSPSPVTFFDSKLFDAKLSKELESGGDRVEVNVSGKVPLSNIPNRIDRWITKVGEEGSVEIKPSEPAIRTRSIFGFIPMIFSAFKQMNEERTYAPANQYDATIYYRKDDSGDTLIEKVIFTRRGSK